MSDNDAEALQIAGAAVTAIDVQYRLADGIKQDQLAEARDRAWTAYSLARQRMLMAGVIVTDSQLNEIDQLSKEIAQAAETMDTVRAVLRLAQVLGRIALA